MDKKNAPKSVAKSADEYRGVDINISDDEKVTPEMVKKDVKELNNNPRTRSLRRVGRKFSSGPACVVGKLFRSDKGGSRVRVRPGRDLCP